MWNPLPDTFAISGALVYDGLGNPPAPMDLVVADGRIAALRPAGELNLTGVYRISGTGLYLAPGFIDAHSHSDTEILRAPQADSKISQGVTTEVTGQCGFSPGIAMRKNERDNLKGEEVGWDDLASYAVALKRREPAVNIATLCGHNTLRQMVMKSEDRPPTPDELRRMQEILQLSLRQGAAGFSSGLWYIPGKYADTSEMIELAKVLKGTGKPYVTHLRTEGDNLLESTREAVRIAASGDGRLQISHIKTGSPKAWGLIDALLDLIGEGARASVQITADRYPYLYSGTGLRMILGPPYDRVANLHQVLRESAEEREKLVALLETPGWPLVPFDRTIISNSGLPENAAFLGLTLVEIGKRLGISPARACVKFLTEEAYVYTAFGRMNAENLERFLALDWVACGSDAAAYPFDHSQGRAHPRAFGSFPRFFQAVRKSCGPAAAIRRMTSLAAAIYNLPKRGVLREGYHADLVLFNEDTFVDRADFVNPHTICEGVHSVFVNGKLAFTGDDPEKRGRHGDFLRV